MTKIKYLLLMVFLTLSAEAQEILVDAVLASVDGKPITLQDVEQILTPKRVLTLKDFLNDHQAKVALEDLIMEKVILHEAEARKISVSSSEIEDYINEVAKRNNLSRPDFERALAAEGKNIDEYKRSLRLDILKSKLTSSFVRGSVAVSEEEIDAYIESNPSLSKSGSKIKLSQIMVSSSDKSEDEALTKLVEAQSLLQGGADFHEVAGRFSEGPGARDGGSLGIIALQDLSAEIRQAVSSLEAGEVSPITRTAAGLHIFMVEERFDESGEPADEDDDSDEKTDDSSVRAEVKRILLAQKSQEKLAGFFTNEIFKSHTIERKI